MKSWGLNQGYTQLAFGVCMHDQWMPPVPPIPLLKGVPGLFDGPAFMGAHPGRVVQKVGRKTLFDGNRAVMQGHDVGYLIPHLAMPFNVMMGINMLVSKHKVMFPITKVLIEGVPMGSFFFMFLGLICSQPVSLPTGICVPFAGTVIADMTLADMILGVAFIVVDVLVDLVWSKVFKGKWTKFKATSLYQKTLGKIFQVQVVRAIQGQVSRVTGNVFVSKALDKVKEHLGKSWVMSPLFSGSLFQTVQTTGVFGVPRTSVPSIAIGRAGANLSFFPKLRVGGNVFN